MRMITLALIVVVFTTGCGGMTVDQFSSGEPKLVLEEYFLGHTRAWGLFEDRFGNVQREFVVDIEGTWDGKQLTLAEYFVYSDGERESRVWTLEKTGPDTWSGTADNVIGTALGRTSGNAFNSNYYFNLKVDDSTWKVHFKDWMFLQPNGVILNKATITRWGLKLGTVFISFSKTGLVQTHSATAEAA
jgi:hypothetical protein